MGSSSPACLRLRPSGTAQDYDSARCEETRAHASYGDFVLSHCASWTNVDTRPRRDWKVSDINSVSNSINFDPYPKKKPARFSSSDKFGFFSDVFLSPKNRSAATSKLYYRPGANKWTGCDNCDYQAQGPVRNCRLATCAPSRA